MRKKKQKLEKIILAEPRKDGKEKYLPYCNFSFHQGIIKEFYEDTCKSRKCHFYKRLYIR